MKTDLPVYQKIEKALRKMIDGFEYEPGDQIPSERELAEKFNASRMTVRRAVELLTAQGLLERRSTSGTYVSKPLMMRNFLPGLVQSLSRQIQGEGGVPGSKMLLFANDYPSARVARHLNLGEGSHVFIIQRQRFFGGLPFCIETCYLPAMMFAGLSEMDVSSQDSLYAFIEQKYGIFPSRSFDKLKIIWPTLQEADLLGLSLNDPVLYFRSVVYESNGLPFEFVKSINHPYRVVFQSSSIADDHFQDI